MTTSGEILEVDLMHDAGHWRHNAEIGECLLPPFQKFIAFAVALEFNFGIAVERIG
jgi:hypothetical protein